MCKHTKLINNKQVHRKHTIQMQLQLSMQHNSNITLQMQPLENGKKGSVQTIGIWEKKLYPFAFPNSSITNVLVLEQPEFGRNFPPSYLEGNYHITYQLQIQADIPMARDIYMKVPIKFLVSYRLTRPLNDDQKHLKEVEIVKELNPSMSLWNNRELQLWMKHKAGLEHYMEAINRLQLNGDELLRLQPPDLEKVAAMYEISSSDPDNSASIIHDLFFHAIERHVRIGHNPVERMVESWTCRHLCVWLQYVKKHLYPYIDTILIQNINGMDLLNMTFENMWALAQTHKSLALSFFFEIQELIKPIICTKLGRKSPIQYNNAELVNYLWFKVGITGPLLQGIQARQISAYDLIWERVLMDDTASEGEEENKTKLRKAIDLLIKNHLLREIMGTNPHKWTIEQVIIYLRCKIDAPKAIVEYIWTKQINGMEIMEMTKENVETLISNVDDGDDNDINENRFRETVAELNKQWHFPIVLLRSCGVDHNLAMTMFSHVTYDDLFDLTEYDIKNAMNSNVIGLPKRIIKRIKELEEGKITYDEIISLDQHDKYQADSGVSR